MGISPGTGRSSPVHHHQKARFSRPFQALLGPAGKHLALQALEEIRGGILSGRRVELPSAQRQAVFVVADLVQA